MRASKLGNGSKRRISHIHWKRREVLHAVVLFVLMAGFSVWLALWLEVHHFD
jgi:cytoskeletal protein RodZ